MFVAGLDIAFNLIMLGVTLGLFRLWRFRPYFLFIPAVVVCQTLIGGFLATRISRDVFEFVRFAAQLVFLHWTLLAVAIGWAEQKESPKTAWAAMGSAFLLIAVAIQAFVLEPYQLEIQRLRIESPKLERPLKIVFLSDPQMDEVDEPEKEPWLLVMRERPDLILLGGDYVQEVDERSRSRLRNRLNGFLRRIGLAAPLGIFAVNGNLDLGKWDDCFAGLGAKSFSNTGVVDLPGLRLTALSFQQSLDPVLEIASAPSFHLVLGHSPNFALGKIDADLLLAGHTHGGQVRLPGFGPVLVSAQVPREMADGMTVFPDGRRLLVSRGVGMERGFAPRMRFLCPPEFHVIELVPAPGAASQPVVTD